MPVVATRIVYACNSTVKELWLTIGLKMMRLFQRDLSGKNDQMLY